MKNMPKWMPVVIALLSIAIFSVLILRNEKVIEQGKSIFISLRPADPRSILQGDYMALRYEMNFKGAIPERKRFTAYVKLDASSTVIETRSNVDGIADSQLWQPLIIKKVPHQNNFYPAVDSYLFAEGLERCYSKAAFAEFKVTESGQALLYRLTDERLRSLNCEEGRRWRDGS